MMRIRAAATVIAAMLTVAGGTWAVVNPWPPGSEDSTPGNALEGMSVATPKRNVEMRICNDDDLTLQECEIKDHAKCNAAGTMRCKPVCTKKGGGLLWVWSAEQCKP